MIQVVWQVGTLASGMAAGEHARQRGCGAGLRRWQGREQGLTVGGGNAPLREIDGWLEARLGALMACRLAGAEDGWAGAGSDAVGGRLECEKLGGEAGETGLTVAAFARRLREARWPDGVLAGREQGEGAGQDGLGGGGEARTAGRQVISAGSLGASWAGTGRGRFAIAPTTTQPGGL